MKGKKKKNHFGENRKVDPGVTENNHEHFRSPVFEAAAKFVN
jgi:hypothetical protein